MSKSSCAGLALGATLTIAGCAAVRPAGMALPPTLAGTSERVPVDGLGGWQSGTFTAGEFSGSFTRSATRLAFFDPLYERRDGRLGFSYTGPGVNRTIGASCRMRERTVTLGDFSVRSKPMAFRCEFDDDGRGIPSRLEIQEVRQGLAGALNLRERRGEVALDGVVLEVRSVHQLVGSPLRLATPIGYVFERNGAPVGAVETNGTPVIVYGPTLDPATRRAVLTGALALGMSWDPAQLE